MIQHIHHINFLVKDLDQAIIRYQQLLGLKDFILDDLPGRSVKTARVLIGPTWLVLVQPVSDKGIPAQHLKEHGEGFFLISYGTEDIDTYLQNLAQNALCGPMSPKRDGLDNWRVTDFPQDQFFGVQTQLAEEKNKQYL